MVHSDGAVAENSHPYPQVRGREGKLGISWDFETFPTDIPTPIRLQFFPKSSTNWEPGIQIYEPMRILIQPPTPL